MVATTDAELELVDRTVDVLLSQADPKRVINAEFRGARFDAGLAWVQFPVGAGGLNVRPELNRHVEIRLREAGALPADPMSFFMDLAGPTLATHGSLEQQRRFLRPMFTGDEVWCQLFSEPGAGSDFAGLSTRARRDGDEWIVDGQKVWNTLAHIADWGMLVARTDPQQPKHAGLTYFAIDMRSAGVEVRPLRQITGEAEFNEVYLNDVRIPDRNRIGEVGAGWRVALTTLMNERQAIGASSDDAKLSYATDDLIRTWNGTRPEQRTPGRVHQLMKLWVRAEVSRLTNVRAAEAALAGTPGPEGSIAKLQFAELNKDLYSFCLDLLGPEGMVGFDYTLRRPEVLDPTGASHSVQHAFLRVRANSIEGGTSEILRNVIGEQVLGLPGEPRVDKGIPWTDVRRS